MVPFYREHYREDFEMDQREYLKSLIVLHKENIELQAFLGLLIFTSVFKSEDESVHSLYATDGTGRNIFRCTVSKQGFLFILTWLLFDKPSDCEARKIQDPTAQFSNIFSMIIESSQCLYSMGAYVCIDEMLVPFQGGAGFRCTC